VAIIYCGSKGLLTAVPRNKIREFETEYIGILGAEYKNTLKDLKAGKLTDEVTGTLERVAKELAGKYKV